MSFPFPTFPVNWSGSKADINVVADPTHYWGADEVNFLSQSVAVITGALEELSASMQMMAWLTSTTWTPDGGLSTITGSLRTFQGGIEVQGSSINVWNSATPGDGNATTVLNMGKSLPWDTTPGAAGDAARVRFYNNDIEGTAVTFVALEGHISDPVTGSYKGRFSVHVADGFNDAASSNTKYWFTNDGITLHSNANGNVGQITHSGSLNLDVVAVTGALQLSASSDIQLTSQAGTVRINHLADPGLVTYTDFHVAANSNAGSDAIIEVEDLPGETGVQRANLMLEANNDFDNRLNIKREVDSGNLTNEATIRIGVFNDTNFAAVPLYITASIYTANDSYVFRRETEGGIRSGTISMKQDLVSTYEAYTAHDFYGQATNVPQAEFLNLHAGGFGEGRIGAALDQLGMTFKLQNAAGQTVTAGQIYTEIVDASVSGVSSDLHLHSLTSGTAEGITVRPGLVGFDNSESDIFQIRNFGIGNTSASLVTPAGAMIISASNGVRVSGALEITGTAATTLYLHSANGARWAVTCSNAGVLGVVSA
jgi:hypothetical protein